MSGKKTFYISQVSCLLIFSSDQQSLEVTLALANL